MSDSKSRLAALRAEMKRRKLAGYIVPRQDEHQGEYVGAYAERLQWLTGFKGSWGLAIVALRKAAIFVDGRYTLQVREQVNTKLFTPCHLIDEPPQKWIERQFKKGDQIGFDPWVTSLADARRWQTAAKLAGAKLVPVKPNLVDGIWTDQPARPSTEITLHGVAYAGVSAHQKLREISTELTARNCDATVLADPASVCWALNIRGNDVPHTPVPLVFAILRRKGKALLFADASRFTKSGLREISKVAELHAPQRFESVLHALGKKKLSFSLDPNFVPEAVRLALSKAGASVVEAQDPCVMPRARKNDVEQAGARAAHIRDGAAMCEFLCWFEKTAPAGKLTEKTAADKLKACREATGLLRDLSFSSISASGPNAAIPHYHVEPDQDRAIKTNDIYLIDSGGQYLDGTTDITRTVIVGLPTAEMKDRFTRVLKGMISLARLRFPKGTTGAHIDALARQSLWAAGLDFDHGTGHGVGSYLSVHEGPARISKASHVVLEPGMLLSNEPGYYKAGHFGIRIETLILVTPPEQIDGGDREMMGFETITLCPIDRNLIDTSLLTRDELRWLDQYHARVLTVLGPLVSDETHQWLRRVCAPFT